MNNRLALLAAAGVFAAGLGLGTMTAGPSTPSAVGMNSLKLRDDPEQGIENLLQAEQRKSRSDERERPGKREARASAAVSQGDDSDDRRRRSSNNVGGDEGGDDDSLRDDSSRPASGVPVGSGGGGGDDDDDGGDDNGGED